MNILERLKHACASPRCVVLLLFTLLIISHPREAAAAVAAPDSLSVSSSSSAQITVTWAPSTGASRYQVERATNSAGPYAVVGNPTTNSFSDGAVAANTTYIYRVRALDSTGNYSNYSNAVLATAVTYTDEQLSANATPIRAVHLTELRQVINSVQRVVALPDASWTDANLAGANVRGVHLREMRDSLN